MGISLGLNGNNELNSFGGGIQFKSVPSMPLPASFSITKPKTCTYGVSDYIRGEGYKCE